MQRFPCDRINWQLRVISSDSVTQQFGDPRSIGFKDPYPKFQMLTVRTGFILFSPPVFFFFFLLHLVVLQPPHPLFFFCTSAGFGFSFLHSSALLGPGPLIPKLVYIGEINAVQMRLNTYSKNCRQCVSGLSPESGGKRRAPRWHKAGEPE